MPLDAPEATGDIPQGAPGFETLLAAIGARRGAGARRIGRLFGIARLAVAAAWRRESGRPLVFLTAHNRDLLPGAADLEVLLAALGEPRRVLRLPGPAANPYAGVAPHLEVLALRATALAALAEGSAGTPSPGTPSPGTPSPGTPPVVIASAAGALCRTAAPERLRRAAVLVRQGMDDAPGEIAARLAAAGYRYEDPVSSPGDFARRGGIVDLFPVDRELPLRVEFGFDGIDEIREFEVETQRSGDHLARPESVQAPPSWEWIGADLEAGAHPAFRLPGTPGFESGFADYLGDAEVLVEEPDRFWEAAAAETARVVEARLAARESAVRAAAPPEALLVGMEALRNRLEEPPPAGAVQLRELESASPGGLPTGDLRGPPIPTGTGRETSCRPCGDPGIRGGRCTFSFPERRPPNGSRPAPGRREPGRREP